MYHGLLPSKRIRWCCADFKEGAGAGRVTLTGVRRKESARRARRNEMEVSGRRFSGTADEFERWQAGQVEKIRRRMLRQQGKHLGEDYFSIDKDREVRCIGGKDTIIVNPLLDWSEQDVWYFLDSVAAVPHCELYDRGYRRIGCILCPMSSYRQKVREMQDYPHVRRLWIKAIKEIRRGGSYKAPIHASRVWEYTDGRMDTRRGRLLDAAGIGTASASRGCGRVFRQPLSGRHP